MEVNLSSGYEIHCTQNTTLKLCPGVITLLHVSFPNYLCLIKNEYCSLKKPNVSKKHPLANFCHLLLQYVIEYMQQHNAYLGLLNLR